jgi:thiol:disulfide interchange protein
MTSRHLRTALRLTLVVTLLSFTLITRADDFAALGFGASAAGRGSQAHVAKSVVNKTALPAGSEAMLAVSLDIGDGYHAQSHKPYDENLIPFTIKLDENPAVTFGEPVYPPGKDETYPNLGKLSVYTKNVIVRVPVKVKPDAKPGPIQIKGKLRYQICDDKACFPPESPAFTVETKVVPAGTEVQPNEPELFKAAEEASPKAEATPATGPTVASTAANAAAPPVVVDEDRPKWGVLFALGAAFVAGILFNIVPCVLPVLPIKVLGFAEIAQHDRAKTIFLSTIFGLGIVSVFAVLAVLILVLKTITWGQQFANPVFAWAMVILLLVLSLWLFGVLNVGLPTAVYAFSPRHDTAGGNYLWGVMTAVLSTPCTGPLFVPVMGWAATQPQALGVSAMMMVGVGMAFPYVVLSAFPEAARKFPRVGPWSELFKQMLGFILLAFTVFFAAGRFTSPAGQWWAAVPVAVMAALYLMARTVQLSKDARPVAISSLVAVTMVTAAVLVACRFSGVFDARPAGPGGAGGVAVDWTPYSDSQLESARKAGKIVLVKFTANWCLNCQYVEATVFHDDEAIKALRKHDVVTLKADLTSDEAPGWGRLRDITPTGGIPLTAIYAPGYDKPVQITSVYTTATLVRTLDQLDGARTVAAR